MIRGELMPGFPVELDDRTAQYGGSWLPCSGDPLQAYNPDIIGTFYQIIRKLDPLTLLDAGANTGSFCLLAKFIPHMRCVAIEPVSILNDILVANVEANNLADRVRVLPPVALSDYIGGGVMKVLADPIEAGLCFLDDRPHGPVRCEPVPVTTIDRLRQTDFKWVDAIKIDVEHSEARVLVGAAKTIKECRPVILIESTLPETTLPLLKLCGYTVIDYQTDFLAVMPKL